VQFGAIPVFVDVDLETHNVDADLIEAAITPKTKAIKRFSLFISLVYSSISARHTACIFSLLSQHEGAQCLDDTTHIVKDKALRLITNQGYQYCP
jgi:hypothetical protein